jgi:hypothetical protein
MDLKEQGYECLDWNSLWTVYLGAPYNVLLLHSQFFID